MIYPWDKGIITAGQDYGLPEHLLRKNAQIGNVPATQMHSKITHANSEEATLGQLLNLLQTMTTAG